MEAVGNLDCVRRTLAGTVGQGSTAVSADHLHARVLPEPGSKACRGRLRQQVDGSVAFLIDEDQGVVSTATMGPLIDAEDARRADGRRFRSLAHQPQQRHPTGTQVQASDQSGTRPPAECQSDRLQELRQEMAAASVDGDQRWQPLAEDTPRAGGECAAKAAREHAEQNTRAAPAQVGNVPLVAAVHQRRWPATHWTGSFGPDGDNT
jgi:hypothetical protein